MDKRIEKALAVYEKYKHLRLKDIGEFQQNIDNFLSRWFRSIEVSHELHEQVRVFIHRSSNTELIIKKDGIDVRVYYEADKKAFDGQVNFYEISSK